MDITDIAEKLGTISAQVDDLHGAFYRNGFKAKIDNIETTLSEFDLTRAQTCPVIKEIESAKRERRTRRYRTADYIMAGFALVITITVGLPAWLAYLGG